MKKHLWAGIIERWLGSEHGKGRFGCLKAELASPLVLGAVLPPFKGPREIL